MSGGFGGRAAILAAWVVCGSGCGGDDDSSTGPGPVMDGGDQQVATIYTFGGSGSIRSGNGGTTGMGESAGVGATVSPRAGSGAGGGGEAGVGGASGAGGASFDPALDMRRFVPDIPNTYDGTILEPGMEIIAHTLGKGSLGAEWLVAVENKGSDFLCAPDVRSKFFDSAGLQIASGMVGIETPLQRGSSGQGGFVTCLGPGDIGMANDRNALSDLSDDQLEAIASVTHSFGALILIDAVPSNEITLTNVAVSKDPFDRNRFTGTVVNGSPDAVRSPDVTIFGVNAVGRPLVGVGDIELITLPAGASWSFETLSFEVDVADHVGFVRVSNL